MHFWMIQVAEKEVFAHFLEFRLLGQVGIACCDRTNLFLTWGNVTRSWRTLQQSLKSIFEWSKDPKNRFSAIFYSAKCFPTFGNITRSWRIIQRSLKCIFEWSKEPKKRFLAIFCSLVCWVDFSNFRQHYQVMKDHSKIAKKHSISCWVSKNLKMPYFALCPILSTLTALERLWLHSER